MKNTVCVIVLFSLFITIAASAVLARNQPENQTIDVVGTGRIRGEDISGARAEAISDCLVSAISLVTADLLQQQVFIQSFQDINQLLFSGADEFVQDYKVLTEDTTGRNYRVMVQTTVSVIKIRELLIQNDILSQNAVPLKVLLLIAEKDLEEIFYKYWWGDVYAETMSEAQLAGALSKQGFVVVDHRLSWPVLENFDALMETPLGPEMDNDHAVDLLEQEPATFEYSRSWQVTDTSDTLVEIPLGPEMSSEQTDNILDRKSTALDYSRLWPITDDSGALLMEASPGPEMSNTQAAALGARFQADVVVVGTATVKKASNVLGDELRSFEGALSVRAIRADTGDVLAEIKHTFITADADDLSGSHRALTGASAQTGELLAWKIQTVWQQTLEKGPNATTIIMEGAFQLPHLVAFRGVLSGMDGVSNLQTTEMTPRETILSLDYDGTTKELAEALLLNSFKGFGVHITEATPETIRLSLVSN